MDIKEGCAVFTVLAITSMAACKSLFSGYSRGVMYAVEWCGVTFVTADGAFRGCVRHSKTIGMPGHKFMVGSLQGCCSAQTSL